VLHVHRATRADHLVGALADVLSVSPADPMTPEVVAVHSLGIERWLAQELSLRLGASAGRADGICANVQFAFRRRIMDQPLALPADARDPARGRDDVDPWSSSRLVWRLLELLEDQPAGLDIGPLAPHLADRAARFGATWRVVDLFDRYAVHRPRMLLRWLDGDPVDAVGQPLAAGHRWQAGLWRELRARVDVPSRPERQVVAVERLREGSLELDLPPRLSLFNLTALAASDIELLQAIAVHREVHLFLLHASPALWDRVAREVGVSGDVPLRDDDRTAGLAAHPLFASWGRDARELQLVLAAAGATSSQAHAVPGSEVPATASMLERLQADINADRRPPGAPVGDQADRRAVLHPHDRSVQVHSCHGRTRQVEVLRDAIGHLLAADPQLQPRDIVVLCPEVEQFAPLVHAVFGAEAVVAERDEGELPQLRVRIADRSLRESNPLMEVVSGGAGARRRSGRSIPGARPGGARAGAAPVPAGRRRPGAARVLERRGRRAVGLRCAAPRCARPGGRGCEHLACRARPHPGRRRRP
jgi:exodeoxyribonuclease V gamma subunit